MLDSKLIHDGFDEQTLVAIAESMLLLHNVGIFTTQVKANCLLFASSFTNGNPTELLDKILEVQQTNRQLLALHEFCGKFKEGLKDA